MQLFCGVLLQENERIRDNAFVSKVRSYLSKHLDLNQLQQKLVDNWKKQDLADTHILMMDATCYESYIRYPTDVKLLWECCEQLWGKMIPQICKTFKLKQPRSKYAEQRKKYLHYSKLKRKTYRKTKARKKALLYLLIKGIDTFQGLLDRTQEGNLSPRLRSLFKTIKTVYWQQEALFQAPSQKIKDRIVSLHKPYVRPIVRGKENKPVEFGVKTHMNQTAGVNMIEYASFNNFNECKRLKPSVKKHKLRFKTCSHLSADRIYATNENRKFITAEGIQTNFDKKGPVRDDKPTRQIKDLLNKGRSAYMEGSFGNEKNHYCLRKIKALSEGTEMVWLYFGVMTANAVRVAKAKKAREKIRQAA
jgi:hypothetical protein